MTKNTGGPAFPCETLGVDQHGEYRKPYEGMTLRDYFAAKAMQGMLSANGDENGFLEYEEKTVAKNAYKLADAMLKAREE